MSFSYWLIAAGLALLPLAAAAQQSQQPPNAADANAPVPAAGYVSAFKNYRAPVDEDASPDKIWRAANEAVQGEGGHAGHAPSTASGKETPANGTAVQAKPGSQPSQSTPQADPHAGHGAHTSKGP